MSEEEFKKWAKKDDASNENYEDIDETPKLKKMKISDPQDNVEKKKEESKTSA